MPFSARKKKQAVYPAEHDVEDISASAPVQRQETVQLLKPQVVGARGRDFTDSSTISSHTASSTGSPHSTGSTPQNEQQPVVVVPTEVGKIKGTIDRPLFRRTSPPSPRDHKMDEAINNNTLSLEQPHAPPVPPKRSSSGSSRGHRNRRSNSDIPASVQGGFYHGVSAPPAPSYTPGAGTMSAGGSYGNNARQGPPPPAPPPPYPYTNYYLPPYNHSNMPPPPRYQPYIPSVPQAAPPRPYHTIGHPPASTSRAPIPFPRAPLAPPRGMGERAPLVEPPQLQQQHLERSSSSRRQKHKHRKSLSSSAAMPGSYGAFWNGDQQIPPDQTVRRSNSGTTGAAGFSPRAEFRKLAQGLSPTDFYRKSYTSTSGHGSRPTTPTAAAAAAAAGYMGSATPPPPRRHHRMESSRKMHMRQQSAQLFMAETKGVEQELVCRNVFFLLLFVFHLLFLGYLGTQFGGESLEESSTHGGDAVADAFADAGDVLLGQKVVFSYNNLLTSACLSGVFAATVSGAMLGVMSLFARSFVQIALMITITLSFMWGTIGIGWSPKTAVPVTGIIALALAVAYTFIVWDRIPFAAANLVTALSGIRAFRGTIIVAFCFQALALAWSVYFAVLTCGIYDAIQEGGKFDVSKEVAFSIYALLGISFCWTFEVLKATVQAITAGVIGGWWYHPENGAHVRESCFKTLFYSMGSICFGSLLVVPVGILRQLSALFRPSSPENSTLMCLHECIYCIQTCMTSCVDAIAASINRWAFTYVGLYQYGFLDAGYNATELFDRRGWSTIVSDDLIPNVLLLTSLVIGGITGCFALFMSRTEGFLVSTSLDRGLAPFVEGFIIGLVLTSVIFSVISGAVNAVLVCFASSPVDFESIHPELSHEMRSAWREVWPGALDMCDLRLALEHAATFNGSFRGGSDRSIRSDERQPLL